MNLASVNLTAVVLAALISFLAGFVWYGLLFSKPWMAALGLRREDIDESGLSMTKAVVGSIVASLATALGISILFSMLQPVSWGLGLSIAAVVWLAFSLGPMFKMVFWEDRPVTLFAIDGGYELASIVLISLIIIAWP